MTNYYDATFSIVARCNRTLQLGVAVCTANVAVGNRVPHVQENVGVAASQGKTNPILGKRCLQLMGGGLSPADAIQIVLSRDPEREARQLIVIGKDGRTAAHTGSELFNWKGHLVGNNFVVAGNILAGEKVLEAMAKSFDELNDADLPERLLASLEAGQKAGGDKRGHLSAALIVINGGELPFVDLRVDAHSKPIVELKRILAAFLKEPAPYSKMIRTTQQ